MLRPFMSAIAAVLATASTTLAQPKEPIGRFVVDLRATSAGLPIIEGWTPVVPDGTEVPSRALGFEAGAHLHILRFGSGALGIGATWATARGKTAPVAPAPADVVTPAPVNKIPDVTTKVTVLSPQVSLNFGHSLGWSYLSAGLGRGRVESEAVLSPGTTSFTPRDSGWAQTFHYGGGARWFIRDHVGVGFDLRWHRLRSIGTTATHPGAPRTSLFVAGVGLVLK